MHGAIVTGLQTTAVLSNIGLGTRTAVNGNEKIVEKKKKKFYKKI